MNLMSSIDYRPYLQANLTANPVYDAGLIIARREKLLGRSSDEPAAPSNRQREARQAALTARLDTIRSQFWSAPLSQLKEQLNRLPVSEFPDLDIAIARLKQVALCRPDFPRLAQHRRANKVLFNALKAVVVLPPSQAGATRERANRSLAKVQPQKLRRMITMMKKEFPHLYQLEADWLKQVGRLKKYAASTESALTGPILAIGGVVICIALVALLVGLVVSSGFTGAGGIVGIIFILRVIGAFGNND